MVCLPYYLQCSHVHCCILIHHSLTLSALFSFLYSTIHFTPKSLALPTKQFIRILASPLSCLHSLKKLCLKYAYLVSAKSLIDHIVVERLWVYPSVLSVNKHQHCTLTPVVWLCYMAVWVSPPNHDCCSRPTIESTQRKSIMCKVRTT